MWRMLRPGAAGAKIMRKIPLEEWSVATSQLDSQLRLQVPTRPFHSGWRPNKTLRWLGRVFNNITLLRINVCFGGQSDWIYS